MNTHDIYIDWEFPGTNPYKPLLTWVIAAALEAEGVRIPCGVDVLLTDDEGIREINRERQEVDSVTDVLSFPMLNLTPGTPPDGTGEEEHDPETGLCYLGTWSLTWTGQGPGGGVRSQRPAGAGLSGGPPRPPPAGV